MLVDAHCDTIVKIFLEGKNLFENDIHVDLQKLSHPMAQFFAIFFNAKNERDLFKKALRVIDFFYGEMEENKKLIGVAKSVKDINKNIEEKRSSAILSIEGGEILEGELHALRILHMLGVRAMTLTWNHDNEIASGARGKDDGGVTSFGVEVINLMNEMGILIDVSHLNDKSFYDVMHLTNKPVAATHSNARRIHPAKRNLSDEQIRLIATNGGVIGINLYAGFLAGNKCSTDDVMRHIEHIINVGGSECVGFGSDFDGIDEMPSDIRDAKDMSIIINKLERRYGINITDKIKYKNFMRLLSEVWKE